MSTKGICDGLCDAAITYQSIWSFQISNPRLILERDCLQIIVLFLVLLHHIQCEYEAYGKNELVAKGGIKEEWRKCNQGPTTRGPARFGMGRIKSKSAFSGAKRGCIIITRDALFSYIHLSRNFMHNRTSECRSDYYCADKNARNVIFFLEWTA